MEEPIKVLCEHIAEDGRGVRLAVYVDGELDLLSAPSFEAVVRSYLTPEVAVLSVDLGAVPFLDAAGVRALVTLSTFVKEIRVPRSSAVAAQVLRTVGLAHWMEVPPAHSTEDAR